MVFRREQIMNTNPKYVLMPRDATMDILPIVLGGLSSILGMLFDIYSIFMLSWLVHRVVACL
jgi:hypothetical protein